jgi:hypothetical protein
MARSTCSGSLFVLKKVRCDGGGISSLLDRFFFPCSSIFADVTVECKDDDVDRLELAFDFKDKDRVKRVARVDKGDDEPLFEVI